MLKNAKKILMVIVAAVAVSNGHVPMLYWDMAKIVFPSCQSEDSDWCVWDADQRGNRIGESFISINGKAYIFDRA